MFDTVRIFTQCDLNLKDISNWHYVKKDLTLYWYRTKYFILYYYPISKSLHCSFSCPKAIYSDNTYMVYEKDLNRISKKITNLIKIVLKRPIKEIKFWDVSRIDFCYNFFVKNVKDKKSYISMAKKNHPPRMKNLDFKTGAFFCNASHSFKLYDKSEELKSRQVEPELWQEKILRFEISMRRKKLLQIFGCRLNNEISLDKLFKNSIAK